MDYGDLIYSAAQELQAQIDQEILEELTFPSLATFRKLAKRGALLYNCIKDGRWIVGIDDTSLGGLKGIHFSQFTHGECRITITWENHNTKHTEVWTAQPVSRFAYNGNSIDWFRLKHETFSRREEMV